MGGEQYLGDGLVGCRSAMVGNDTFPLLGCPSSGKWRFIGLIGDVRESQAKVVEGEFTQIIVRVT